MPPACVLVRPEHTKHLLMQQTSRRAGKLAHGGAMCGSEAILRGALGERAGGGPNETGAHVHDARSDIP
eukprot:scaffold199750_cov24-Tisochrysis_lutea.AAC.1